MSRKTTSPTRTGSFPLDDDEPTQLGEGLFDGGEADLPMDEAFSLEDLEGMEDLGEIEDERTHPGVPLDLDTFEDSRTDHLQMVLDPRSQHSGRFSGAAIAPEPGQGAWRERAFIPRGVVPKEQIIATMEQALQIAAVQKAPLQKVRVALRAELMPLLRQAVEQAGGDGIDAWLSALVEPPGTPAGDPLLMQLAARMERFGRAASLQALLTEARALTTTVKEALFAPSPKKLSFKVLEEAFDGRIELDTLLSILFCNDEELAQRREQVDGSLDSMRAQMRSLGASPDFLMGSFSRLKVEKRVIDAELARRG